MNLIVHDTATKENTNWLRRVSRKREFAPAVVGSNYQPLGTRWFSKPIDHPIADRKLNQIVSVNSFRGSSILFLGGWNAISERRYNDVHEMDDSGKVILRRRACEWSPRCRFHVHASLDGSKILLIGGDDGRIRSDTWLSHNGGREFVEQSSEAPWKTRTDFASCLLNDDTIVICGGMQEGTPREHLNDVWISTDNGKTWLSQSVNSAWGPRSGTSLLSTKDGSILLVGGVDDSRAYDDVWLSRDRGINWSRLAPQKSVPWKPRHSSKLVQDPISDEIVLLGGFDHAGESLSDTWASTDGGLTWISRPHLPLQSSSDIIPIVNNSGTLSIYTSPTTSALKLYASISDLKFIQRDCLFLLMVGKRIELHIPKEIWVSRIVPMALDTRQLWLRKNTDWQRL